MQDVPYIHTFHVRQPHAHQRYRQQAGFMHHFVGGNENPQHRCQRGEVMQILRQPLPADHGAKQPATDNAEHRAAENHPAKGEQTLLEAVPFGAGNDEAVNHHGEEGADRVDDNALPAQNVGDRGFRPHHAQHRHDDGRAGDQCQAAEQDGQHPVEAEQKMRGDRDDDPGRDRANGHQAMNDAADLLPLRQVQGQAALKQNQRDRQRHQRHQQRPEHLLWIEPAQHRADQNPRQQQKQNRRQLQAPGQPLATQRGRADPAKCQENLLLVH
ncbi:hypothetical protein D3C76_691060 [compost metagenome]